MGEQPLSSIKVGTILGGDYRILAASEDRLEIGSGAMGAVYLAEDLQLGRKVVIKTLKTPAIRTEQEREEFLMRFRKEAEMTKGADALRADGFEGKVKVLTSCPSCLQGLSRFDEDAGTTADYIVVEIARRLLGASWMADYVAMANRGGIERVLL